MKSRLLTRTALILAALTPLGFGVQRPKPAPPPTPVPAPAPAPTQDEAQKEEKAKQERIEHARQAEAERLKQEQETQRIKRAREEANEAERIKRAREEAGESERIKRAREEAGQPTDPSATNAAAARAELRETARDMFTIEGVHRERLGRIDRLLEIYRESGDQEKLGDVETLKRQENKRYLHIIDNFKAKLGSAYAQFEPQLLAGQMRRAAPPAPAAGKPADPAPAPAPKRVAKPPVKNETTGGGR